MVKIAHTHVAMCLVVFGILFSTVILLQSGLPLTFAASAPNILPYQGRILNDNGVPIADATANMQFRLYDSLTVGTCLWSNASSTCASNANKSVTLTDGLFSENLGDTGASYAAILDTVFADNTTVYLEVEINGEVLTPRKQVGAAAYAFNADTLDGVDSTGICLLIGGADCEMSDSGVTFSSIGSGGVNIQTDLGGFALDALTLDGGTNFIVQTAPGNVFWTGGQMVNFLQTPGAVEIPFLITRDLGVTDVFQIETRPNSEGTTLYGPKLTGNDGASIGLYTDTVTTTQGTTFIGSGQNRSSVSTVPVTCAATDIDGVGAPISLACFYADSTLDIGVSLAGTDLTLAQGGFDRTSGSTETFAFTNGGAGVLDVSLDGSLLFPGVGASISTGLIPFFGAPSTFSGLIFDGGTDNAIGFGADFISMNQTQVEFLEETGESSPGAMRFYYDDAVTAAFEGRRSTEYLWRLYPMTGSTGFVFEGPSDGNDDTASIQWQASEASNTGTLHIGSRFLRNGVSTVPVACLSDDLDGGTPNAKACMMANSTFVLGQDVGSTDIVMAQAGFSKDSGSTETITFTNPGAGVLDVSIDGGLTVDTTTLFVDGSSNEVGIGTITPDAKLDIEGAEDTEHIRLTDSTNVDSAGIYVGDGTAGLDGTLSAQAGSIFLDVDGKLWVNIDGTTDWTDLTAASGANTALSNLASVAINTSLLPGTDDSIDLGDNTHRWRDLFLGPATLHIGTSTAAEGTVTYTDTTQDVLNFSTDATANADIAFFTDDLYLDKSSGFVGIGDATPSAMLSVGATSQFQVDASGNITTSGTVASNGATTAIGDAVTDNLTVSAAIQGTNALFFDGSTDDTIETIFAITDPTVSDKTITFQNASGTVAFLSDTISSTLTDNVTDALDIQEGTNNYVNINTTDASENISFGNATTNPTFSFLGSGTTTLSGGMVFSGVTTDITAASGQDLQLVGGASTGSVVIRSNDELTQFQRASGSNVGVIDTTSGVFQIYNNSAANPGLFESGLVANGFAALVGSTADIGNTLPYVTLGDNRASALVRHWELYGGGNVVATQLAHTSGSPTMSLWTAGAHTTLAASTEATDINFDLSRTVQFATGALTTQRAFRIQAPTYGFVGASTLTDAATVSIDGAPVEGTNNTLTNTYALKIEAGAVSTAGTSYGLYVDAPTGAGSNFGAVIASGNVGIGDTTPDFLLDVAGTFGVDGNVTLGDAVTDNLTIASAIQGTNALFFDGATDDTIETIFAITDPTVSDKTITFQNATGTVAFLSDIGAGFDSTTVDNTTWSDGANASNTWTFDVSGTDHTMVFGNGLVTFGDSVTVTDALNVSGVTTLAGSADGTDALVLTLGDILVTNGDLDVAAGDFNVTLDGTDDASITKTATGTAAEEGLEITFNATTGTDVDQRALVIDVDSADHSASTDIVVGLDIENLTGADAEGTETALRIGTGWDNLWTSANSSMSAAGTLTSVRMLASTSGTAGTPAFGFVGDAGEGMFLENTNVLAFASGGNGKLYIDGGNGISTLETILRTFPGDASLPGVSVGDTNTGLYEISEDRLGVTTGGTLRFDISTTAITSTLPFLGPDGAQGTPTYSFSDDTDTGMYSAAADEINFAVGGDPRLRLAATFADINVDFTHWADLTIEGGDVTVNAPSAPATDMVVISNSGQATATSGADALFINYLAADGTDLVNSAINVALTANGTASGDTMRGLFLDLVSVANASSTNKAIEIENTAAWDVDLELQNDERIDNVTDDVILLSGTGGTNNTSITFDLDGASGTNVPAIVSGGSDLLTIFDGLSIGINGETTENISTGDFAISGGNDLYVDDKLGVNGSASIDGDLFVTGSVLAGGTEGSPAYKFQGELSTVDTGLYLIGEDNIGISTGGTLRFDISATTVTSTLPITTAGDLAVNGADITTTSTGTATVFNTNATTLNIGGAATTLNLAGGSASTGCTIDSAGALTCSGTSFLSAALTDNTADALDIQEGTNNYLNVNTTNSSEAIAFGNATTNPDFTFLGSGDISFTDTTPNIVLAADSVFSITDGTNTLLQLRDLSTNFGATVEAGAFIDNTSYFNEEFNVDDQATALTADSVVIGDADNWYFDTTTTQASFQTPADTVNGIGRISFTANNSGGALIGLGSTQNDLHRIFLKANLPVFQAKLRTDNVNAVSDIVWGLMDQATAPTGNDSLPSNGIFFWHNNTTTWTGYVRSGGTDVGTATCTGAISTTQFAVGRIEVLSATSVRFLMDYDASDGIQFTDCGTVSGANPTAAMGVGAYVVVTNINQQPDVDVDYIRVWQDDAAGSPPPTSETEQVPPPVEEIEEILEPENIASGLASDLSTLNMTGNIFMQGNQILEVGKLAGMGGVWIIETDGTMRTEGAYMVAIESYQGETIEVVASLNREHRISLNGVAQLMDGEATVVFEDMDPSFNDITSTTAAVNVLLTPRGPVYLYVVQADRNGFTVKQLNGSDSGIAFDWMVSAYRKDYEPIVATPAANEVESVEDVENVEVVVDDTSTPSTSEPEASDSPISTDEPVIVEPPVEEPPTEEPIVEEPPAVEPPAEEPPADEPVIEAPPAEEPPAEILPAEPAP